MWFLYRQRTDTAHLYEAFVKNNWKVLFKYWYNIYILMQQHSGISLTIWIFWLLLFKYNNKKICFYYTLSLRVFRFQLGWKATKPPLLKFYSYLHGAKCSYIISLVIYIYKNSAVHFIFGIKHFLYVRCVQVRSY